mmetsp:Transcript_21286/g.61955  ORF Transcript_21286/g.61955 Transcript_21286/m.61955 type:complete len:228 (-) Transcript_21286:3145-3828(-)
MPAPLWAHHSHCRRGSENFLRPIVPGDSHHNVVRPDHSVGRGQQDHAPVAPPPFPLLLPRRGGRSHGGEAGSDHPRTGRIHPPPVPVDEGIDDAAGGGVGQGRRPPRRGGLPRRGRGRSCGDLDGAEWRAGATSAPTTTTNHPLLELFFLLGCLLSAREAGGVVLVLSLELGIPLAANGGGQPLLRLLLIDAFHLSDPGGRTPRRRAPRGRGGLDEDCALGSLAVEV